MPVIGPPAPSLADELPAYRGQQRPIWTESHVRNSSAGLLHVEFITANSVAFRNVPRFDDMAKAHGQMSSIGTKNDPRTDRLGGVAIGRASALGFRQIDI